MGIRGVPACGSSRGVRCHSVRNVCLARRTRSSSSLAERLQPTPDSGRSRHWPPAGRPGLGLWVTSPRVRRVRETSVSTAPAKAFSPNSKWASGHSPPPTPATNPSPRGTEKSKPILPEGLARQMGGFPCYGIFLVVVVTVRV